MDMLTTAADAILSNDIKCIIQMTPKKNSRTAFRNLTNGPENVILPSSLKDSGSSFNTLLQGKISNFACSVKSPRKRKKNSMKYGDENEAPIPKISKHKMECHYQEEKNPVSPLSNLKLLTRIASMEERMPNKNVSSSKNDFQIISNFRKCYSDYSATEMNLKPSVNKVKLKRYSTSSDLAKDMSATPKLSRTPTLTQIGEGSRRDKSLGLLCERFLEHFPIQISCLETPRRLIIDVVAATLGTERRRVYDIVNILECLNMVTRVQKNMYQWMGNQHLETTLTRLKALALSWGLGEQSTTPIDQSIKEIKKKNCHEADAVDKSEARKNKSLGVLCQKFIMLFLTSSPPYVLQFDNILHLLLGKEGEDFDRLRTRGRRIYDIANVLIALQLMKKVSQSKSFMYIGPSVEASELKEALLSDKQVRMRHSLLPPLHDLIKVYECTSSPQANIQNQVITPTQSNLKLIQVPAKKGRPRKLASEFVITAVNQNGLKSTKCEVNHKIKSNSTKEISENSHSFKAIRSSSIIRFPRLGSPRMALTFQNLPSPCLPAFTSKPPTVSLPQIQVKSHSPIYLQKVNTSKNVLYINPKLECNKKPGFVIQSSLTPVQTGAGFNPNGIFKVYSKQGGSGKLTLSPSYLETNKEKTLLPNFNKNIKLVTTINSFGKKSASVNTFPNINLNTMAKNHYKTVIGNETIIPTLKSSSTIGNKAFHFVINTNKTSQIQQCSSSVTIENKSPSFVKMFESSPDNSSTDSELESIFGDSFKFTRPKALTMVGLSSENL